jgi:hypothetical protein
MTFELPCGCGHVIRADDETALIRRAQEHAEQAHRMALTSDLVLIAAFRAELDGVDPIGGSGLEDS